MKLHFKKDTYTHARGGYSRFLDIFCGKCNNKVLVYQKDGAGSLRRIYVDRIISPDSLKNMHLIKIDQIGNLTCKNCGEVLGIPYVYEKENRKAFRLFVDAVTKKVRKSDL